MQRATESLEHLFGSFFLLQLYWDTLTRMNVQHQHCPNVLHVSMSCMFLLCDTKLPFSTSSCQNIMAVLFYSVWSKLKRAAPAVPSTEYVTWRWWTMLRQLTDSLCRPTSDWVGLNWKLLLKPTSAAGWVPWGQNIKLNNLVCVKLTIVQLLLDVLSMFLCLQSPGLLHLDFICKPLEWVCEPGCVFAASLVNHVPLLPHQEPLKVSKFYLII